MLLFHLAGHSGAGKSRLTNALSKYGINFTRTVLYTSRIAREGEIHGRDYYFLSKSAIASLNKDKFFIGPVREMLQAVDLIQLKEDLESKKTKIVFIEIFSELWPNLHAEIIKHFETKFKSISVFLTAVDPEVVKLLPNNDIRGRFISNEVERILTWRNKDKPDKIQSRANSAIDEILCALGMKKTQAHYDLILHSSPEGPDGQDEWTKEKEPVGKAKTILDNVVNFIK
jgi:hypothetical protein